MSSEYKAMIEMIKTNPGIFKKEYTFDKEKSIEVNELIKEIREDNFRTTKEKGDSLENLVDSIFNSHQIYKVKKNLRTSTNEIDLFLELDDYGTQMNINLENSLLESESLVECKNYNTNIGVSWIGKFASLLRYSNKKTGFFISKLGVTGEGTWSESSGLIKKIALKDNIYIINLKLSDFENLEGKTIFDIIRLKKQEIDLDVDFEQLIETHDLEK